MPKAPLPDADEAKPASPVMQFLDGGVDTSPDRGKGLKPEQHSSSMALDDNEAGLGATFSLPLVSVLPEIDIMLRPDSAPLLGPSTGSNGVAADVKGEASALWVPALVGMDCGRVDKFVTIANNLGALKVPAPLPDLSADTSSAPGCSNVDEELMNVGVCVSGDCCVDPEEPIDSESIQQFAVPLHVAGASDECGESVLLAWLWPVVSMGLSDGVLDKRLHFAFHQSRKMLLDLLLKQSAVIGCGHWLLSFADYGMAAGLFWCIGSLLAASRWCHLMILVMLDLLYSGQLPVCPATKLDLDLQVNYPDVACVSDYV
ncbi:hypothetical protein Nepgr_017372 [Nepenthes gracilis]|uniref:Uncharacterized protein n=1 Tax=Nepenthes gracilis TaxID=150966 RepID=A0AAD3SSJ0_NEPGR|nr:hypothetical protein Nepgr_017372 [Nepenthes gracilis]